MQVVPHKGLTESKPFFFAGLNRNLLKFNIRLFLREGYYVLPEVWKRNS